MEYSTSSAKVQAAANINMRCHYSRLWTVWASARIGMENWDRHREGDASTTSSSRCASSTTVYDRYQVSWFSYVVGAVE